MSISSKVLPENILKCLPAAKRRELGQQTAAETMAAAEVTCERELQKQILGYLRTRGITVFAQRMDRRTRGNLGQPDFLFAWAGAPMAFEIKLPGRKLEPHQERMGVRLLQEGWFWAVVHSVEEAKAILEAMG